MRLLSSSIIILQAFFLIWWTNPALIFYFAYSYYQKTMYFDQTPDILQSLGRLSMTSPSKALKIKHFCKKVLCFSPIKSGQFQPYFQRCCFLEVVSILIGLNRHRITTFSRAKLNRQTCRKETKMETKGDRPKQPHSAQVSQRRTWINNIQTNTHKQLFSILRVTGA